MKKIELRKFSIAAILILCSFFCRSQIKKDTVKVAMLVCDTSCRSQRGIVYWKFGYSVRNKHNTDEGQKDPYNSLAYNSKDYYVHIYYLDNKKQPIKPTIIVWQSVIAK